MSTPKRGFIFNSVSLKKPRRNVFNLSYENKLTCNMGELVPFFVQDVLPHDTIKVGQEYIMRAMPLIAPIFHRVDIYQHYFFVPLRLIWDDFEKFITGGDDGTFTATHPYFDMSEILNPANASDSQKKQIKLLDLLGYPTYQFSTAGGTDTISSEKLSSLRVRAYNLIYNEFYRDENLQTELLNPKTSSKDTSVNCNMQIMNRAWKKDYFTSALPFAQRGPQVGVPWSGGNVELGDITTNYQKLVKYSGTPATTGALSAAPNGGQSDSRLRDVANNALVLDPNGTLKVDSIDINLNDLRRANAIQRWFERNARGGARYVEQILSHFGIRPSDYRLQRPMYLGGGRQPFMVSEVVQTSGTLDDVDTTPQANLAGKAVSSNRDFIFKHTFEEHGIIIGILSVLPRATYQQGCSRLLQKFDKFDYAQPEFSNLGEQEVLNKELYCDTACGSATLAQTDEKNNAVFGYQSRYAEYKYNFDQVHGYFKTSLDFWHLGREFSNRPLLNSSFITAVPRKDIFAVEDEGEDCLLFDFYNNVTALRCLSAYGTPAL